MKVNSVNNQIALKVNGISSPQLLLLKPLIKQLISDEMEIVHYTGSCLSKKDDLVIEKIEKESLTVEKFDEENLPTSIK